MKHGNIHIRYGGCLPKIPDGSEFGVIVDEEIVRKYTVQVDIVSYGEEKPVAMGHDNDSFTLNRRVEIVYK